MRRVKRLMLCVWLVAATTWAADKPASRARAGDPCPVLKVNITELPASHNLLLHPGDPKKRRIYTSDQSLQAASVETGIDVAVLWQNRTGQRLQDVTLRFEYQQARAGSFRTLEQAYRDLPAGGRWTEFFLRGPEFEDTLHIAAWRVTILSAGQILGQKQSAIWTSH